MSHISYHIIFILKIKIDLLEKYTFEEDIDHKIGFTTSHPQGFEIAQQSNEASQPDFKI